VGLKFNDKFKEHVLCKQIVSLNISFMTTNAPLTYTNTVLYCCYMFRRHAILREINTNIWNLLKYIRLQKQLILHYSILAAADPMDLVV
jgi:hypothetical protein